MKLRTLALGSAMLLGALGCSSKGSTDKTTDMGAAGDGAGGAGSETQTLEVFSWWTAPGEAEALTALEDTYKAKYKDARVAQYSNSSAATWQMVLGMKIDETPQTLDVCQLSASDLDSFQKDHPDALAPLDDVYAAAGLDDANVMIPEIKDVVTRDGHPYGVVTGVHRNNSFIYNKQIFDDQKLDPPTSVDELLAVSAKLKAAGITPIATDFDTWVLRIVFDEILAGEMGAQGFDDFIKGKVPASDPDAQTQIQAAIDAFDQIITDYVDVDRSKGDKYDWSSAAQDLHDGKAAMLMHGDWAKGFLVHLGWTPGVDFGVLGPPGASDLFVYGADMFFMPSNAPHPSLAQKFLGVVASPEGQVAFNSYKGATPMREDVKDQLDEPGQLSLDGLIHAKVLMPGHANDGWDKGIETFAMDHDKAALLKVYTDTAP